MVVVRGVDLPHLHMQHFACFACRKAFKQPGSEQSSHAGEALSLRPFPCPDCGVSMAIMGRDFAVPPQRDRTGWLVSQLLQSCGILFEPGIHGPGHRPRKLREAIDFLTARGHDLVLLQERIRFFRSQQGPRRG